MEEEISSKSEMNQKINKQFIKKYKSFEHNKVRHLKENQQECRHQSCNNLINFVPKILPKKSSLKPSLFVLNPNENTAKKLSQNLPEHNLLVLDNSDSDSDDNSSELKSCKDDNDNIDEKNTGDADKEVVEKDVNDSGNKENEELINNNSKQEFESYYDNNNGVINNNSISDENKGKSGSNYLTIFDVLSKNYK